MTKGSALATADTKNGVISLISFLSVTASINSEDLWSKYSYKYTYMAVGTNDCKIVTLMPLYNPLPYLFKLSTANFMVLI